MDLDEVRDDLAGLAQRAPDPSISRCGSGREIGQRAPPVRAHKSRSGSLVPPVNSELTYVDLLVCLHNGP